MSFKTFKLQVSQKLDLFSVCPRFYFLCLVISEGRVNLWDHISSMEGNKEKGLRRGAVKGEDRTKIEVH